MKLLVFIITFTLKTIIKCDDDLIVNLLQPDSKIQGHRLKTETGREYYAFQEIPYATPPIGSFRLQKPDKVKQWDGVLNTTKNTKICMQTLVENPYQLNATEDCLYLNIYTPQLPRKDRNLATLVWIHPGNFVQGSGIFQNYNPEYFMEYDIIVVTLNYRLGLFGFLWINDDYIPGNLGLRDQLFALDWLYDNIMAFGGDPWNMALVGQGSGAASIAYHYQYKRDTPFSCAILQSGSSISPQYFQPLPIEFAAKLATKFNPEFNFSSNNLGNKLKSEVEKISAEVLLEFSDKVIKDAEDEEIFERLAWLPVVEGFMIEDPYLQYPMLESWSDGGVRTVQTMLGFNSGEMAYWASQENLTALGEKYDNDPSLLINTRIIMTTTKRVMAGTELKHFYTNKSFAEDHDALVKYLDDQMVIPIIKHASNSSWYMNNYVYKFSYKSESTKLKGVPDIFNNVAHGEEMRYFWKSGTRLSDDDRIIQKRLLTLWTNFIKYKDPTPDTSDVLNGSKWRALEDFGNEIKYLDIGMTVKNDTDPINFQRINEILDSYIEEPLAVF